MSVELGTSPRPATLNRISVWSRFYGFGSIYAKTLRDSRLAFIIIAGLLGGLMLVAGAGIGSAFSTTASRQEMVDLANGLPAILQGIAGKPVHIETLGGYLSWKYGPFFIFIAALWSILALSGTLAAEARRGSLEFVASAPFGRRRLALEKLAAHLTVMAGVTVVLAVSSYVTGAVFGSLPGDAISLQAAVAFAVWVGLLSLVSGSVAFALSPYLGRPASAGIAGIILFAGYLFNGYKEVVPAFDVPAKLSWFDWTAGHLPLAGLFDWVSLLPVIVLAVVLFAVGVEAFSRRDLGDTTSLGAPGLPGPLVGLRGPVGRSFGERLPAGLWWGLGLGVFGLVIAASSRSLADEFAKLSPDTTKIFRDLLPSIDITSSGGFLQLVFVQIGFIIVGFAGATFVSGWASDETSERLEMLLSTPLARSTWAVGSGIGVLLAILVMNVVFAIAVGIGSVLAGSDALTPMAGSFTLGLYAAALAGIGFAIGGFFRTGIAAEIVALVVTVTFLIDLLAPALKLPDWVHQLALTAHMGQPMIGIWDPAGVVACIVLAVGGLVLGGIGLRRRDVAR